MNQRLDQICLLPPPTDTPWSGTSTEANSREIRRKQGDGVQIDLPLFWCDPPWHRIPIESADALACGVAQLGVCVTALRSEISKADQDPAFFLAANSEEDQSESTAPRPPARILPYRPERYGLSARDFDGPRIVDVRLLISRDESGRFAYSPDQLQRWEGTPDSEPLAGGGWVPAATFPPDVASMEQLASKLEQLRALAPSAAVFVSMGPYRLEQDIPRIVAAGPDGLIIRLDELRIDGLRLAMTIRHACDLAGKAGEQELPVWIVPGRITPDDAAKLIALGAAGVAIDHWCDDLVADAAQAASPTSSYGYSSRAGADQARLMQLVEDELSAPVGRFRGLLDSMQGGSQSEILAALDPIWADALGLPAIDLPLAPETW